MNWENDECSSLYETHISRSMRCCSRIGDENAPISVIFFSESFYHYDAGSSSGKGSDSSATNSHSMHYGQPSSQPSGNHASKKNSNSQSPDKLGVYSAKIRPDHPAYNTVFPSLAAVLDVLTGSTSSGTSSVSLNPVLTQYLLSTNSVLIHY